MSYHIKDDGTPGICTASVRPCPKGGSESHYDTYEEAYDAAQEKLKAEHGGHFMVPIKSLRELVEDEFEEKGFTVKRDNIREMDVYSRPLGEPGKTLRVSFDVPGLGSGNKLYSMSETDITKMPPKRHHMVKNDIGAHKIILERIQVNTNTKADPANESLAADEHLAKIGYEKQAATDEKGIVEYRKEFDDTKDVVLRFDTRNKTSKSFIQNRFHDGTYGMELDSYPVNADNQSALIKKLEEIEGL